MAKPDNNTPLLEWIAATLGAAAIIAILSVIVYGLVTREETPPTFHFETSSVTQMGDRWHVRFRVTNSGDIPAANVKIVGKLGATDDTAEVTLRYVPDRSSRDGGLYFGRDPRTDHLILNVAGYEVP
jgi:uncharacterized protein (TIGR02588 family)